MPINYKDFRPYVGRWFWYTPPKVVTQRKARLVEIIDESNIQIKLEINDIGVVLVNATPDVLKQMKRYPV
jgi:hypothetical protein